jgi:D-arginine dehydrogenase
VVRARSGEPDPDYHRRVSGTTTTDFVVIGGGIAGASAAYELQDRGSVLLLERERLPGFHTTGRSAAFLVESYGKPTVQRLTRAGRDFLESPPDGFAATPILAPRPCLTIARDDQRQRLADKTKLAVEAGAALHEIDLETASRMCPVLRRGYAAAAVLEPAARSIDVAALLDGYLRGFRARGGELRSGAEVTGLSTSSGDGAGWEVRFGSDRASTAVVVNAAGAWGEQVGRLAGTRPIGLRPLLRTAITFDPPAGAKVQEWPCLLDADEDFYLKPEGAQLLASPCDETPSEPCDAQPGDLAVALAAERVQRATTLELRHINRRWAGLRSFVADRVPVIGMDSELPGFFWLVGQGGFGIMTSSGAARAAAGLIGDGTLPVELLNAGLREEDLSPERADLGRR